MTTKITTETVERALREAARETAAMTLERFVRKTFNPLLSEFLAYVDNLVAHTPPYSDFLVPGAYLYRRELRRFVEALKEVYPDVRVTYMYVSHQMYNVNTWGALYWSFMHYAAILTQQALVSNTLNDVVNFPLLVRNIDFILPCNVCATHYRAAKGNEHVEQIVKRMSFGHLAQGVYQFHEFITKNIIHQSVTDAAERARRLLEKKFTSVDHLKRYGVHPVTHQHPVLLTYTREPMLWQSARFTDLCILLAFEQQVSLHAASDRLKRTSAAQETLAANDLVAKTSVDERAERDVARLREMSDIRILECIARSAAVEPRPPVHPSELRLWREAVESLKSYSS